MSAADSNPDGDAMTNLEEFLFGGNPKSHEETITPLQADIQNIDLGNGPRDFAVLEVVLNRAASQSVNWKLLTTADGETWVNANTLINLVENNDMGNGMEMRRYRVKDSIPDTNARIRLFKIESRLSN